MGKFYTIEKEKIHYFNGQKFVHESVYLQKVNSLLNTAQSCQKRYRDAENLLNEILKNRIVSFIFGARIRKHLQKYSNHIITL